MSAEPSADDAAQADNPKKHRKLPLWAESGLLVVVALVIAVLMKTFFVQAFVIPSESMEPGLQVGDRILVQKPSYWNGTPQRGDVVVFKDPGGWLPSSTDPSGLAKVLSKVGLYPTDGHLVKRVVGVAGDTVHCCDDQGRIQVNGTSIDEPYVKQDPSSPCNGPYGPPRGECDWTAGPVPAGHVFVMGDNRNHSADSSFHMCQPNDTACVPGDEFVDTDLVVGKVFALVWPANRFTWVTRPDNFAEVPSAKAAPSSTPPGISSK